MKAKNIDEVIEILDGVIRRAREEDDPLGYFAALYREVTVEVRAGIKAGAFDDGPRMDRLDTTFANRYLEALDAWRGGQKPTRSWRVAFEAGSDREVTILQHLLLGMNAHINLDLAVAAAEVCPGAQIAALERDFTEINDILERLQDASQAAVGEFSPVLAVMDRVFLDADEAIVNFSIRRARAQAWDAAEMIALEREERRPVAITRLDRRAASLARLIREPGGMVGYFVRLVRGRERGAVPDVLDALAAVGVLSR